jgi:diguanylate cyclase (GGDEF)-like protein/PAS domain S-box-containing protein
MVNRLLHRYTLAFGMLIIVVVIVLAVVFFLQSSSVFTRIKSTSADAMGTALHAEASKRLITLSMILSDDLANPLYEYDMLAILQLLQSVSKLDDIKYVIVLDPEGIIVHDGTELLGQYGVRISDEAVLNWIRKEDTTLVLEKQNMLEVVAPIRIAEEVIGWVHIGLSRQIQIQNIERMTNNLTTMISEFEKDSGQIIFIVSLFLLLFGVVLALLISQRLVLPIKKLSEFVVKVGQGNYGVQMTHHRQDELGQLIDSFNKMSNALSTTTVSRRYLDDILNNMHDALIVISLEGEVVMVNVSAIEMLNKAPDQLIGTPYLELVARKERKKLEKWLKQVVDEKAEPIDSTYILSDGQQVPITLSAAYLSREDSNDQIICVAQDVSERRRNEAYIRYLAQYDSLTNLPNRQLFRDRLKHAMEQAIRGEYLIAILFIDLDHFKKINDSIGHLAGDRLLKEAASRLTNLLRLGDTVARVGGDEFIVITEQINTVSNVYHVADLIIDALKKPFEIEGRKLYIGCSIGITFYPFADDGLDSLIQQSDMAMYQAKQRGRGHYERYNYHMGLDQHGIIRLEHELILAIKNGGFHLNYQPLIDVKTNQLVAFEALIRWNHPVRGPLMPTEFLPILESSGMIVELGDWVLETACLEMMQCQALSDLPISLNVNVSMNQFNQTDFPSRVKTILEKTGYKPELLKLEITESCLVDDFEMSRNVIKALKELGLKIAVDDFGTGYSAFTYLRDFDLDCMKLDYSFIKDLPEDQYAGGICKALVAMAKVMDLDVVAEGVERESQLEWLKEHDVQEYQGDLCSPPLNLEQVKSFITHKNQLLFDHRVNHSKHETLN